MVSVTARLAAAMLAGPDQTAVTRCAPTCALGVAYATQLVASALVWMDGLVLHATSCLAPMIALGEDNAITALAAALMPSRARTALPLAVPANALTTATATTTVHAAAMKAGQATSATSRHAPRVAQAMEPAIWMPSAFVIQATTVRLATSWNAPTTARDLVRVRKANAIAPRDTQLRIAL